MPPQSVRAGGVHGDVHEPIWQPPLQEKQEEEVYNSHECKDGAGYGAAVSPKSP